MDTTISELTVTDPERHPDAPAAAAAGPHDQTEETVATTPVAATAPAAPTTPAAVTTPPAASGLRRFRPSPKQGLALAGAFLVGACLCGGVGVGLGAAIFHDGSERGSYGRGHDGDGGGDNWRGENGRGEGGNEEQDNERGAPNRITPPPPPATIAPSTAPASPTPTTSPS
jgi:hypothetical protein